MSATLDVKSLCLGVLTHGEASGYDIKKYFEQTFSHFYLAGYGSIYPALAELAAEGAVVCRAVPQTGRPDRKVYKLTEAGRERFLATLAATSPSHKVRSEFLVLLHFAHLLPTARLAAIIDERIAEFDRDLVMLEECAREHAGDPGNEFCVGYGRAVISAARDFVASRRAALVAESLHAKADALPAPGDRLVDVADAARQRVPRKTGSGY